MTTWKPASARLPPMKSKLRRFAESPGKQTTRGPCAPLRAACTRPADKCRSNSVNRDSASMCPKDLPACSRPPELHSSGVHGGQSSSAVEFGSLGATSLVAHRLGLVRGATGDASAHSVEQHRTSDQAEMRVCLRMVASERSVIGSYSSGSSPVGPAVYDRPGQAAGTQTEECIKPGTLHPGRSATISGSCWCARTLAMAVS